MDALISLPTPHETGGMPLWQAMSERRSVRRYGAEPMSLQSLSQLLWSTHGMTGAAGSRNLRNAPSAGACYPIDAHVVVNSVAGLEPGLYRYVEGEHALMLEREGDVGSEITAAALGQKMCSSASVVFVWTAVPVRTTARYGERGLRYIYTDSGHVGQNMYLAATALGLGCCAIGAFDDQSVNGVLGIDGRVETTVYMAVAGTRE